MERERAALIDGLEEGRIKVFSVGNETFYIENQDGTEGADQLTGSGLLNGLGGDDALTGSNDDKKLDVLDGDEGADTLSGGAGRDVLIGGKGADRLDGGFGYDTASYAAAASGVVVSLANAALNTGEAAGDTYVSIEDVYGTAFDDTLIGNADDNDLSGDRGNDVLDGGQGGDLLDGGDGYDFASYKNAGVGVVANLADAKQNLGQAHRDRYVSIEGVHGSAFGDTLTGGDGYSQLYGHNGNDVLHGGAGGDHLAGYADHDTLLGETGNDSLYGGEGHDWLYGGAENDLVEGGNGDDVLDGGSGTDRLLGGAGYDYASYATALVGVTVRLWDHWRNTGDAAGDTYSSIEGLHGSLHADTLEGSEIGNHLFGRQGWDSLAGLDGDDALHGETGHDTLTGGTGNDTLSGGTEHDRLVGGAGADRLDGGQGWDVADYSGAAARVVVDLILNGSNAGEAQGDSFVSVEEVWGSRHNDELYGDQSENTLKGNGGIDALEGRGGRDHLDGGDGFDFAAYWNAGAGVVASLLNRFDNTGDAWGDVYTSIEGLHGSRHGDTLQGNEAVNQLYGNSGHDVLKGEGGADHLAGDADHDTLLGGAGNDALYGGLGNDVLVGGLGNDALAGGTGADVFRFETALGASNLDTLADFNAAQGDRIQLETGAFGRPQVVVVGTYVLNASLKSTEFKLGAGATTKEHRVIYDQATGALYYDADGLGGAAQVQFAKLAAGTALSASHFSFYTL